MKHFYTPTTMARAFLSLFLMFSFVFVFAQDYTQNNVNYKIDGSTAYVDASPNATGAITILDKITVGGTQYKVTKLDGEAFHNCEGITSVVIPNSVEEIGYHSLCGCSNLVKVTIGTGVTKIGGDSFYNSTSITDVYMSANPETLDWTDVDHDDFKRDGTTICHVDNAAIWVAKFGDIINITFHDDNSVPFSWDFNEDTQTLTISGTDAIPGSHPWSSYYGEIKKIVIENGVPNIGPYAFQDCYACTSVSIPTSVVSIGKAAFYLCSKLAFVHIPSSVKTIGQDAFAGCRSLKSVNIPTGITSIESGTFQSCSSLRSIAIPSTVTIIGSNAFNESGLSNINIPTSVTQIDDDAFSYCPNLTKVNIPATVTNFAYSAFAGCKNLTSINIAAGHPEFKSIDGALYSKEGDRFYMCPAGKKSISLANGVIFINGHAFEGCDYLSSVIIPNSVRTISDYAFAYCNGLTSIDIPASVDEICTCVFSFCENLKTVNVHKSNSTYKSIDGLVYTKDGTKLVTCPGGRQGVNIPSNVTTIVQYAFYGCTNLASITIPNNVTNIEKWSVADCYALKSVTIGSGVTEIDKDAFYHCGNVTDVYCYADPNALQWTDADYDDFKSGKATICHVFNAKLNAFKAKWDKEDDTSTSVRVTFQGDLLPQVTYGTLAGVHLTTYYNSAANVKVDAGTKVFMVSQSGQTLTATEIEDGIINAGQGVILKSDGPTVAMATTTEASSDDYSGNILQGVDVATTPNSSYKYYVLGVQSTTGVLGFFPFSKTSLPAHQAFIKVSSGPSGGYRFDNATGVEELDADLNLDEPIYNLAGQRLGKMQKGINIVNGRKILIK